MINISAHELSKAKAAQKIIIDTLQARGIEPVFECEWPITQFSGFTVLFAVLNVLNVKKLELYTSNELIHHLSTVLRNKGAASTVILSNSSGLRYAVIISDLPVMPKMVRLPTEATPEKVLLGYGIRGQVFSNWKDLGHILVGGMTRSGKSTFIRSLVYQAKRDGLKLLVCDPWSVTFAAMENDPALLMPVQRIEGVQDLLNYVQKEIGDREKLYRSVSGYPETIDEYNTIVEDKDKLPRILVVLEELNATINRLGGPTGDIGSMISTLMWTALKFGIHIICASQDFSAKFMGTIRDQIGTTVCFRVKNSRVATNMNVPEASRIPAGRQGLAISDRFGLFQAYFLPKEELGNIQETEPVSVGSILSDSDIEIMELAIIYDKLSIPLLKEKAEMTDRQARALLSDWEGLGWVVKDPLKDNARVLTEEAKNLLSQERKLEEESQSGLSQE